MEFYAFSCNTLYWLCFIVIVTIFQRLIKKIALNDHPPTHPSIHPSITAYPCLGQGARSLRRDIQASFFLVPVSALLGRLQGISKIAEKCNLSSFRSFPVLPPENPLNRLWLGKLPCTLEYPEEVPRYRQKPHCFSWTHCRIYLVSLSEYNLPVSEL